MSLSLNNVTLTYPDGAGRLTALDEVTLTTAPGGLTVVIGPSGSGKSSLLAVAATLVRPDSGRITVADQRTDSLSEAERAALRREHIGIVFQQPNLLASLTAVEQLQVMAHLAGRSPAEAADRAHELLRSVGLSAQARRRPHQLSGGQRQRVNIARALMNEPEVLLVDEPTSALDHERGSHVMDLIAELTRTRQVATLLVTHDRGQLHHADQLVEIVDGQLRTPVPGAAV